MNIKPKLEQLENRDTPSSFPYTITEVAAPANMNTWLDVQIDTEVSLFLGQFPELHAGIPYEGPNQIIRYDITPQQWNSLQQGTPESTARDVVRMFGGQIPVIIAPTDIVPAGNETFGGMSWEQSSFEHGWWYQDAQKSDFPPDHVYDINYMPDGPEAGQIFTQPEFLVADLLFMENNPYWFMF